MGLWVFADRFEVFLCSRIVGGLTEVVVEMEVANELIGKRSNVNCND